MREPRCCPSSRERSCVGNYNKREDFDTELAFAPTAYAAAEVGYRDRNTVDVVPVGFWMWSTRSVEKLCKWAPGLSTAEPYWD